MLRINVPDVREDVGDEQVAERRRPQRSPQIARGAIDRHRFPKLSPCRGHVNSHGHRLESNLNSAFSLHSDGHERLQNGTRGATWYPIDVYEVVIGISVAKPLMSVLNVAGVVYVVLHVRRSWSRPPATGPKVSEMRTATAMEHLRLASHAD